MADVEMPQLGETVTEGTITKWFKAVGDEVAADEVLFEVSTDKVDSEVPSPAEGVLTEILVEEGDTVDVGVKLAVIGGEASPNGDSSSAASTTASGAGPAVAGPAGTPGDGGGTEATDAVSEDGAGPAGTTAGSAPGAPVAVEERPAVALPGGPGGLVLSPVVRRLLGEHDIDPSTVHGTGLGGRITRSDVEAVIGAGGAATGTGAPAPVPSIAERRPPEPRVSAAAAPTPVAPAAPAPAAPAPVRAPVPEAARSVGSASGDEVIPFTNIRRRTAEHMVRSKATSAHTLMVKEIDYERVEQVRRAFGERFRAEEGFGLNYLPFAARAAVEALEEFPHLNSSVGDDALIVHRNVNLGIAVDLDNEGLIVPVVHNAEELNLRGMARRIRDVADRARTKRLSLDDISGGTFSITNAGPFGSLITGAIINQPQVAILSTDGVSRRPVVVELPDGSESITIHSVGLVAMTFDHRAVDGAYVARFLARMSTILDDRDWAGEL
jgi:pyruvate dehydrogenase E2 component (dihydrolipoamide acetyltransferase)